MKDTITPPNVHHITEEDIPDNAIDFEASMFVEENSAKGEAIKDIAKKASKTKEDSSSDAAKDEPEEKDTDVERDNTKEDDVESEEAGMTEEEYVLEQLKKSESQSEAQEEEELTPEEKMNKILREIAEQPFDVAMTNLEVDRDEVVNAAREVFEKGYFEMTFELPFNNHVRLRSKTINDFIDYTEYVRRLLLKPISQKEFDTLSQMRNLSYAIVELDGDDWSQLNIDDKYKMLMDMSEQKITAIINATTRFWKVAHLLLHPKLNDFLSQSPEE